MVEISGDMKFSQTILKHFHQAIDSPLQRKNTLDP